MGGVVAFEMATQLQRQGHKVAMLAMLDSPAPTPTDKITDNDYDDIKILVHFAIDMARSVGKNLSGSVDQLQRLERDEQLNYFLEQARITNLVPSDFELQQLLSLFKVFKSNLQALHSYIPQVYPHQIIYFQATDNTSGNLHHSTLGWEKVSSEPIEIITVPGDHYTILTKPLVQIVADKLHICLSQ